MHDLQKMSYTDEAKIKEENIHPGPASYIHNLKLTSSDESSSATGNGEGLPKCCIALHSISRTKFKQAP